MHHRLFSATSVIGADLSTTDGINVGIVEDLLCDQKNGSQTYLIIAANSQPDGKQHLYAIHYSYFYWGGDDENILFFRASLGNERFVLTPELPTYYDNMLVLSFKEFKTNIMPYLAVASHRSDNE